LCRIGHLLKRRTDHLSGGEQQRIALARILLSSPEYLLLDEPYSNLDMTHKRTLKAVIEDIGQRLGITCLLISHDPLDTLSWAEEILVLRHGSIVQKGSPGQIYRQPATEYVAGLFGAYNLIASSHQDDFSPWTGGRDWEGSLFLRPEQLVITAPSPGSITGKIIAARFFGSYYIIEINFNGTILSAQTSKAYATGESIAVALKGDPWFI
jgi:ABC-type sugar transport system ATPase subunit